MLTRARLRDDPILLHPARQQDLAQRVVDLMRPRMAEILPLEIDPRPLELPCEPLGKVKRGFPPGIFAEITVKLSAEARIAPDLFVSFLQLDQRRHERLGDIPTAIDTEVTAPIRHPWQRG